MSRQGFYKERKGSEKNRLGEEVVVKLVQDQRRRHKRIGTRKLYSLLQNDLGGLKINLGRDKFFDLLRRRRLLVERRRKYAVTTQSFHRFRVYENLLKDQVPIKPNDVWVCDITYIRQEKGFNYLFLITDAYSRKIVGWELSDNLTVKSALKALQKATNDNPVREGLIHHSDRGFQYCSNEYVSRLKANGIKISMAEAGNCYENALAERMNGILKEEYGLDETFKNFTDTKVAVKEAIDSYNYYRPHWSLGLKIPAKVHEEFAEMS